MNLFADCYLFFRTWRALRPFDETQDMLGASKIRIREFWARRKFAQPAQILGYSSTGFSPDRAGEKKFACWRTAVTKELTTKSTKYTKVRFGYFLYFRVVRVFRG